MGNCIKNFTSEVALLQSISGSAKPPATKPTQPDGR